MRSSIFISSKPHSIPCSATLSNTPRVLPNLLRPPALSITRSIPQFFLNSTLLLTHPLQTRPLSVSLVRTNIILSSLSSTFIYLHHQKRKHHFQTGNVSLHIYSGPTLATSSLLCKHLRSYQPEKRSTKLQVPVIHLTSKVSESQSRHHSRMVNNPSWTPILAVNQNPYKKKHAFCVILN